MINSRCKNSKQRMAATNHFNTDSVAALRPFPCRKRKSRNSLSRMLVAYLACPRVQPLRLRDGLTRDLGWIGPGTPVRNLCGVRPWGASPIVQRINGRRKVGRRFTGSARRLDEHPKKMRRRRRDGRASVRHHESPDGCNPLLDEDAAAGCLRDERCTCWPVISPVS